MSLEIIHNGTMIPGWMDVAIMRSCDTCPSNFSATVTYQYPGTVPQKFAALDSIKISNDGKPMFTGYIEKVERYRDERQSGIRISGRSKVMVLTEGCQLYKSNVIGAPSVYDLAQIIAKPFGIKVINMMANAGPKIPFIRLSQLQKAYEIIELVGRYAGALVYDDPDGNLVLATIGKNKMASGVQEGGQDGNVKVVTFNDDASACFGEYDAVWSSTVILADTGAPIIHGKATDPRFTKAGIVKPLVFVTDGPIGGRDLSQMRAQWEAARRYGRGQALQITTTDWTDNQGNLWQPNATINVNIPEDNINNQSYIISTVTFRKGEATGTVCELQLYPPAAFTPEPINLLAGNGLSDLQNPNAPGIGTPSVPTASGDGAKTARNFNM